MRHYKRSPRLISCRHPCLDHICKDLFPGTVTRTGSRVRCYPPTYRSDGEREVPFVLTGDPEELAPMQGGPCGLAKRLFIPPSSQQQRVLVAFEDTWAACPSLVSSEGGDGAVSSSCVPDTRVPPLWTPRLPVSEKKRGSQNTVGAPMGGQSTAPRTLVPSVMHLMYHKQLPASSANPGKQGLPLQAW